MPNLIVDRMLVAALGVAAFGLIACGDDGVAQSGGGGSGGGEAGGAVGGALPSFLETYPLSAQYPEGGTYDAASHAFFVGSLGDGSVHRVAADTGEETVFFEEAAPGTWWTLGMDIDPTRRRLWVCAMDDRSPEPRAGFIWIFDLETGERLRNHALSSAMAQATCTDVAVTADGRGFVGDREEGFLYEVDFDAGVSVFTESDALSASFVGQNAQVILPDQSVLMSLLYLPSGVARVDLTNKSVTPLEIDGRFSDLTPLAGADGMTYFQGELYVAFTSKLIRLVPTLADWSQAESFDVDVPNGMTDVIATPNGVYMLNGQSVRFALGTTPDPFQLVRVATPK